jgi:hypothetical protein
MGARKLERSADDRLSRLARPGCEVVGRLPAAAVRQREAGMLSALRADDLLELGVEVGGAVEIVDDQRSDEEGLDATVRPTRRHCSIIVGSGAGAGR